MKQNLTILIVFSILIAGFGIGVYHNNYKKAFQRIINHRVLKNESSKYKKAHILKYDIHGIDISHYQGKIDWEKVKHPHEQKSIDFVFMRATVGLKKDVKFDKYWKSAKAENFTRGAYHFYYSNTNSTKQAEFFIKNVKLEKGDLAPVLDIEKLPRTQSLSDWRSGLKNWIDIIEKHYKAKPIIYTGDTFYRHYLKTDSYFKNYPRLWIANYNNVKKPISDWHIWQYTEKGKVEGISEYVDFNVFHAGKELFDKWKIN